MEKCPITIRASSGVPMDAVRAARLQRHVDWLWSTSDDFRTYVENVSREGWEAFLRSLILGDEPAN